MPDHHRQEQGRERARARAARDAAVLAGLLDEEQRRRYAGSADPALTARRVEAERLAVLLQAPAEMADESESAAAALAADARTRRWSAHEGRAECGVQLLGTLFLLGGGLGVLLRSQTLFAIGALCLAIAAILLGVQFFWSRRVAARELHVLLDWASRRPGQLGRGLPRRTRSARSSLWRSSLAQKLMTIVATLGALLLGIEIWSALRGVEPEDRSGLLVVGLLSAGAGLLYYVGGPLSHRAAERRDAALAWLPTPRREGRAGACDEARAEQARGR